VQRNPAARRNTSVNIVNAATVDPLATNTARTGPAGPTVSAGTDVSLTYWPTSISVVGCSGTLSGSTWTFICPLGGTYHFGSLTVGAGPTLYFAISGSFSNIYDFSGAINNSGSVASFGPGTRNISGGIYTGGGTTTTFGAGVYRGFVTDATVARRLVTKRLQAFAIK
jgi:hypothetical protein